MRVIGSIILGFKVLRIMFLYVGKYCESEEGFLVSFIRNKFYGYVDFEL